MPRLIPARRCPCGAVVPLRCRACGGNLRHEDDGHACLLCARTHERATPLPYRHPAELDYRKPAQEIATDRLRALGPEPFRVAVAQEALGSSTYKAADDTVRKLTRWGTVERVSGTGRLALYRVVDA